MRKWYDNDAIGKSIDPQDESIDWARIIPFIVLHLMCFGVIWVGISYTAVVIALLMYAVRIFAIGAFYHRYFSHKTFKTNRIWQFVFALLGATAIQRGPLWWAAHHRQHHAVSDTPMDEHSPVQHGFWWSHIGWFLSRKNFLCNNERIRDWLRFPELVLLDRFDAVVSVIFAMSLYALGSTLNYFFPSLHTSGLQILIWGFFISTVLVLHVTVTINSFSHQFGSRRFDNKDNSRNNWFLALLTFGEGWHNNHHRYPVSARQGFYWWEIDITYYLLKIIEKLGIIRELQPVPLKILEEGRKNTHATRS
jgi:stearoyl-CoA desaturase (delta-9 desaturase)